MSEYFGGALNTEKVIEELLPAFPLRVAAGKIEAGVSPTGGAIPGLFVPVVGYESIPATKSGPNIKGEEITLESGERYAVTHVWTLLGAWPLIKARMILSTPSGDKYTVLMVDVHDFEIHTQVKTRKA